MYRKERNRTLKCHPDCSHGMTLIEVLIALVVLCFGIISVFAMQLSLIKGNKDSKNLTSASILAEAKMEDLKHIGFASITDGVETNIDGAGLSGGIFIRRWTITPNYQGLPNLKQVTLTVTWREGNRDHRVSLNSVFSSTLD